MRIWIFLLLLQLAFVLGNKRCGELLHRDNLIRAGELEASVRMRLNKTDLNFYDHWEISITFTQPVELTVTSVFVNGETGPIYHANGGVTSSAAPITTFESVDVTQSNDGLTFNLRKNWGDIDIRSSGWKIISFSVRMKIKFQSRSIDVSRVVLNNRPMCTEAVVCGTSSGSIFLVNRGEATNPGDWPWLAALFVRTRSSIDFTCGGTLVSPTRVVTAAHCVKRPRVFTRQPRDIIVYLGRHKLFNFEEREEQVQVSGVSAIHIHPDWGVRGVKDADIAVLVLATPAEFTDHVRPACVSFSVHQSVPSADTIGKVVGWGLDEHGQISSEPKAIRLPVVSENTCKSTDNRFESLATNRTFCAGNRDGSGPCVGDSGGGFYTTYTLPGDQVRFQLTGIVSRTLKRPEDPDQCDLQNYVIFTDVYSYRFWLRDQAGVSITWRS